MLPKKYTESITENFPGLVTLYNIKNGQYLYVNSAIRKILNYEPEDFLTKGFEFVVSLIHPEDINRILKENSEALYMANLPENVRANNDPIVKFEYRMRHQNGSWIWLYTEGTVLERDEGGQVLTVLNVSLDITPLKEKEIGLNLLTDEIKILKENDQRFRSFIESVKDYAIFRLNEKGQISSWNEGVKNIFGYDEDEILGQSMSIFSKPNEKNDLPIELETTAEKGTMVEEGIRVRKDGTFFFAIITTTVIKNAAGVIEGYTKIIRDITEQKEGEETIRFQAYHDTLTGLPNRQALNGYFAIHETLSKNFKLAVLFLDLDRFKNINDTLGHIIGDCVLKDVSSRLINSVSENDTVVRLGGDEFIILLSNKNNNDEVAEALKIILKSFEVPVKIEDYNLHITTSIGVSVYPNDGTDIYTLLKNADSALYKAKGAGKNRYEFYHKDMNAHFHDQLALENDLRQAITKDQIIFHYQPIVNKDKKLIGAEALIRWQHPKLGLLSPNKFIPLSEENGFITKIGDHGMDKVLNQYKKWKDDFKIKIPISINISAKHFEVPNFINDLDKMLNECNLSSREVELEITEGIAMNNTENIMSKLNSLRDMGVAISIDDFGTGYSSLSYLKSFPVNRLKIDQSFVKCCTSSNQDCSIIKAIIALGHSLGMEIIAEGVETEEQFKYLTNEGCDGFQGYLFDKPLEPEGFTKWFDPNK